MTVTGGQIIILINDNLNKHCLVNCPWRIALL